MCQVCDPPGGKIHRDQAGQPSGLFDEAAQFNIVWPFLNENASLDKNLAAIDAAFPAHRTAGYTGLVDMTMDEMNWEVLTAYRHRHGDLPFHVAAHWLIPYTHEQSDIERHIDRASELHRRFNRTTSPTFCINGVKFICDGTIDGCTACLLQPYGGLTGLVDPIWPMSASPLQSVGPWMRDYKVLYMRSATVVLAMQSIVCLKYQILASATIESSILSL